jgi:hypothetical protein
MRQRRKGQIEQDNTRQVKNKIRQSTSPLREQANAKRRHRVRQVGKEKKDE